MAQHGVNSTVRSASPAERAVGVCLRLDCHPFRAAPEPFERVEISGFPREDMNNAVEAVDEHPIRSGAFDVSRSAADRLEASLEARASYGPFAVGAFGALTLAQEKFRVTSAASLEVLNSGANGDVARIVLRPQLTVENELLGLVGRVALFAEYPMPDICFWDTFFGDIPYPCLRDARSEVNLLSFGGYRKYDRLINVTDDITLFSLNGETVFQ